jgi:hypothetical protein
MEIIRFYFGSSGNLVQRLFTGPLTDGTLWSSKHLDMTNGHLHLVLANRLSGMSAADIGRIAESRFAWRAAAGIFASCQKAAVQRQPIYPYTGFPIEGVTDLAASGIWLPFGKQEKATFLVYRLRSCSHPFPFNSLSYEAADRKAWHGSSGESQTQEGKPSRLRSKQSSTVEQDAGDKKTQRTATFASRHSFPDLQRKSVWREKIEAMASASVFLRHEDGRLEQVAFGEGSGDPNVASVDQTQGAGASDAPLPKFVQVGLNIIKNTPEYALPESVVKLISPPGIPSPVFSLPVVIDEFGEVDSRYQYASSGGSARPLRGCFVEVAGEAPEKQRLLIVEGRTRFGAPVIRIVASFDMVEALTWAMD